MNNKKSVIEIQIGLDENNTPESITWQAEDDPNNKGIQESKAMLLSFFDKDSLETVKIDLWTKEFQIQEMDRMMFQTLRSLTDTYYKATKNQKLSGAMQQLAQYFGQETGIIPKTEEG